MTISSGSFYFKKLLYLIYINYKNQDISSADRNHLVMGGDARLGMCEWIPWFGYSRLAVVFFDWNARRWGPVDARSSSCRFFLSSAMAFLVNPERLWQIPFCPKISRGSVCMKRKAAGKQGCFPVTQNSLASENLPCQRERDDEQRTR